MFGKTVWLTVSKVINSKGLQFSFDDSIIVYQLHNPGSSIAFKELKGNNVENVTEVSHLTQNW